MGYQRYREEIIAKKVHFYQSLPEKSRRHFLAQEYLTLGHGSQRYLSEIFKCGRKTITKGLRELESAGETPLDYSRQRRPGGGAKKKKKCS